jgi:hypothetical protein
MSSYAAQLKEHSEFGANQFRNFRASKTVHGNLAGIAHKGNNDSAKALALCGNHCRSVFTQQVLSGETPLSNFFENVMNAITETPAWAASVSNAMNNIGIQQSQKDMALTAMNNVAKDSNIDYSTISVSDSPEIAAQKLAIANPDMFAMNPETNMPLTANELPEECSIPADIKSMCNGNGWSQEHALVLIQAVKVAHDIETGAEFQFTPILANKINAPQPAFIQ